MLKKIALLFIIIAACCSCQDKHSKLPDGLYAEIKTSKGDIIVQLEFEKTPVTVANFVSLIEGTNTYVAPQFKGKPFYNGLKFHRVLSNFMIQGGDPLGNGSGDTGYKFKDEITNMVFDKGGVLAMANSGPGTNSSQFFITHVATEWLDGRHTIFGHVVENGMETVNKIVQNDMINSMSVIRKGEAAKKFDAVKVFNNYFATEAENQKKQAVANEQSKKIYLEQHKDLLLKKTSLFVQQKTGATKTATGLTYKIIKRGNGKKPEAGTTIFVDYAGFFENGMLLDTNIAETAKAYGTYDATRAAQNGYTSMPFQVGRKEGLIPGFIEGLELLSPGDKAVFFIPSRLAFGEAGDGHGVIPPNSNLIFEIEVTTPKK